MKRILIALGLTVGVLLVLGASLSNKIDAVAVYEVNGSTRQVHDIVGNLETWEKWGPWMKDDPGMKIERGPVTGVGATQAWQSKQGNGKLVFTKVDPERGISYDLFIENYPKSTAQFQYHPAGDKTRITWTMKGEMNVPIVGGIMAWLFSKMISKSFEDGLKNIETKCLAISGEAPCP